jgi:hypothetical protein
MLPNIYTNAIEVTPDIFHMRLKLDYSWLHPGFSF